MDEAILKQRILEMDVAIEKDEQAIISCLATAKRRITLAIADHFFSVSLLNGMDGEYQRLLANLHKHEITKDVLIDMLWEMKH